MTFIYELDPYSLEIYRMNENELPTSTLSKVIVRQRQTDTTEIICHAASWVVNNNNINAKLMSMSMLMLMNRFFCEL